MEHVFWKNWFQFFRKLESTFSENMNPFFQKKWTKFGQIFIKPGAKRRPAWCCSPCVSHQFCFPNTFFVDYSTFPGGVVEIGCSGYCHNLDYMGPLPKKKNRPCGALQKLASHQPAGCGTTGEKCRQKLHFRRGSFSTFALKHFGWQATRKSKSSPVLFFPSPPSK